MLKRILTAAALVVFAACFPACIHAEGRTDIDRPAYCAENSENILGSSGMLTADVSVKLDYGSAWEVLDQLNAYRSGKGLSRLTMDEGDLEFAMQRAAECAVYYSHTRPDGSSCFQFSYPRAENIAAGYTNASNVMSGWENSPGHAANMRLQDLEVCGIGCAEYDGTIFWVQDFGWAASGPEAAKSTDSVTRDFSVSLLEANFIPRYSGTLSIFEYGGQYVQGVTVDSYPSSLSGSFSSYNAGLGASWKNMSIPVRGASSHISYSSSDPDIFTISSDGVLRSVTPGTATLTMTSSFDGTKTSDIYVHVADKESGTKNRTSERIGGDSRYDTAAMIADKAFPEGTDAVIIASGENFPDALSASGYAGIIDCPILLTRPDSLPEQTMSLIRKWNPSSATLIGGPDVVSIHIESELSGCGVSEIQRFCGDDRYATARDVEEKGGFIKSGACILANGSGYADALSISPWAYKLRMPVILSTLDADSSTLSAVEKYKTVYIVGGEARISQKTEDTLRESGMKVLRLSGNTRYETSMAIAQAFSGVSYNNAVFAYGENFPDALAGCAFAGRMGAPVILVSPSDTVIPEFVKEGFASASKVYILGQKDVVPESIRVMLEYS